ncbi:hypothetical protein DL96DRAFT_1594357 [Flagelloscypha sp. PMI_526]|nr:hypothetical protein DL96DRAFT_1594357 [Flagelloscypha sp. PMI_526]
MLRQLPRICLHSPKHVVPSISGTFARDIHSSPYISDPRPAEQDISMSHPRDPRDPSNSSQSQSQSPDIPDIIPSTSPPPSGPPPSPSSNLPSIATTTPIPGLTFPPSYSSPPFHTHAFFKELEKTFPTLTARSLMRATRALLIHRVERVQRAGLATKDLDNEAYLFRAALSEMRAEFTMNTKNDVAAIQTSSAALRREVENLTVQLKEDIDTLKHEIQMELDTRKNEARADIKEQDIEMESLVNKAVVNVSDLRTDVEETRWDNLRRAVLSMAAFLVVMIGAMEVTPKRTPPPPPLPPLPPLPIRSEVNDPVASGNDRTEWT